MSLVSLLCRQFQVVTISCASSNQSLHSKQLDIGGDKPDIYEDGLRAVFATVHLPRQSHVIAVDEIRELGRRRH